MVSSIDVLKISMTAAAVPITRFKGRLVQAKLTTPQATANNQNPGPQMEFNYLELTSPEHREEIRSASPWDYPNYQILVPYNPARPNSARWQALCDSLTKLKEGVVLGELIGKVMTMEWTEGHPTRERTEDGNWVAAEMAAWTIMSVDELGTPSTYTGPTGMPAVAGAGAISLAGIPMRGRTRISIDLPNLFSKRNISAVLNASDSVNSLITRLRSDVIQRLPC